MNGKVRIKKSGYRWDWKCDMNECSSRTCKHHDTQPHALDCAHIHLAVFHNIDLRMRSFVELDPA